MRKTLVALFVIGFVPGLFAQAASPVQIATVTLSSAQLRVLHGSPVQLIPAPGVGQVIAPISVVFQYKAGTTPYTVGSGARLAVYLGTPNNVVTQVAASGFLDQAASQVFMMHGIGGIGVSLQSTLENAPVVVRNDDPTEWANGDGTVTITTIYTVLTLQ
jgi:hypothetical protein